MSNGGSEYTIEDQLYEVECICDRKMKNGKFKTWSNGLVMTVHK